VNRWYGYRILLVDAALLVAGLAIPAVSHLLALAYLAVGPAFHGAFRARVRWRIVCAVASTSNRVVAALAGLTSFVFFGDAGSSWLVPVALASLFDGLALGWRSGPPLPPGDRRWYGFLLAPVDACLVGLYLAVDDPLVLSLFVLTPLVHLAHREPYRRFADSLALRVGAVLTCVALLSLAEPWRPLVPLLLIGAATVDAAGLAYRSVARLPGAVVLR
jgi:hypothetical protein